jgi:hypothetical protein
VDTGKGNPLRAGGPAEVAQTCYPLSGNICAMQAVKPTESKSEVPAVYRRRGWLHAGMAWERGSASTPIRQQTPPARDESNFSLANCPSRRSNKA